MACGYGIIFFMDDLVYDRFMEKIFVAPDGCWLWLGSVHKNGYGKFRFAGRVEYAHRVAYLSFVGEIASGLVIDHLCRKRSCVNPAHLEAVTSSENTRRGLPTHSVCVHGVGVSKCDDGCAREMRNAASREWRKRNPGYGKNWRENNPDYHKRWRENNPNYFREYNERRRIM